MIVFWSTSAPFCPILVFMFQMLNQKVIKSTLFHSLRRPSPKLAANIGQWYTMIKIVAFLAIPINALQLAHTHQYVGK